MTQQRLLVMLYERVMRDIDDAERAIHEGDRHACNEALLHAQDIVAELERALDPNVWDAAKELATVYVFVLGRLVRANVKMDLEALAEARSALDPLREAWTAAWQATLVSPGPGALVGATTTSASATSAAAGGAYTTRQPLDIAG